jgi:hypothetical protein
VPQAIAVQHLLATVPQAAAVQHLLATVPQAAISTFGSNYVEARCVAWGFVTTRQAAPRMFPRRTDKGDHVLMVQVNHHLGLGNEVGLVLRGGRMPQ